VRIDPARMLQHKLSTADVVSGLAKANVIAAAGRVADSHRMILTVVTTDLHDADQLAAMPIASADGQPITVRDVASVELSTREDYIRTASENGAAVLVGVSRQPDGNTVAISAAAHELLRQFRAQYPDTSFSFSYDQAALVTESFRSVRDAIVLGLVLAVAVVFMFTGSLMSAMVAAIVVPATIAITFVAMRVAGMSFNMMTLGGLAAGIGLFIDDAIVMIEAIHRAHAGGIRAAAAVDNALAELTRPLIASTATVVVGFAPLVLLSGVTGVFFRALALTLGAGLFISLLLALYFTPALELMFERWRRPARSSEPIFRVIRGAYLASLRPFIRFPPLAIGVAAIALIATYALYRTVGTDYLPALDEGGFVLDFIAPPQSTLADTEAMIINIQETLRRTPEVAAFSRRIGTQLGFFLTESNRGDMSVRLRADRSRDIQAVIDDVRAHISGELPAVRIEFSQVLQDLIGDLSGTPEPIEVKVLGSDQATIEATARRIAASLRNIKGLVDVSDGLVLSSPAQQVVIDSVEAQRYGLDADTIQAALRTMVEGTVATQLRVGDRLLGVRVRYPDDYHVGLAPLPSTLIATPQSGPVPLSALAAMYWMGEQTELDRERMRPVVHVTARVEGIDLGAAASAVQARMATLGLPAGVSLEYGGLYADQQRAFRQLGMVLAAAIFGMFLVLVWEFGQLKPALAVIVGALSCLAGAFAALELTGITLNISSFMGIIMVAGITAKNGILLLDRAEHEIGRGSHPRDALREAARVRIRPILMTTLATAAGLFPLALGLGAGAKVQQPLALAVIGGLLFAMLLSTPLAGGIYLIGASRSES
jgi:multidrug efflux pump subunit AcrB